MARVQKYSSSDCESRSPTRNAPACALQVGLGSSFPGPATVIHHSFRAWPWAESP